MMVEFTHSGRCSRRCAWLTHACASWMVATASSWADAGHHEAEHVAGGVRGDDADDPAAVHHRDPVGQRLDLLQFGGDDQHGGAAVAFGDDALVQELDGADVDAAGRLTGQQQRQRAGQLAGEHHLLLVAARQRLHRLGVGAGTDVELLDPLLGVLRDPAQLQQAAARVRVEVVEDEVLGDGELADEAVAVPVLGHVAESGLRWCAAGLPRVMSTPSRVTVPESGFMVPSRASASSVWPLPWTPAMQTISPPRTSRLSSSTATAPDGLATVRFRR